MPSERIDLTHRADPAELTEWMDEPCSFEEMRACHASLDRLNALTLAARPTLAWLTSLLAAQPSAEPLRILDVGSGGGGMLRRIGHWTHRRGIKVQLTGIDLHPDAARIAREFSGEASSIRFLTGNAYDYTEPVDVVISSLLTHHLSETEIVQFLRWMESTALRGWFVNDLCREPNSYRLYNLLTAVVPFHRFVRHDGLVSFRRSFREGDWTRMLAAAAIPIRDVELTRWTPARLCVGRIHATKAS